MYQKIFGGFELALRRLRPAFSRKRTWLWFCTLVMGLAARADGLGVTSAVRALDLREEAYAGLMRVFRSTAVDMERLAREWCAAVRDMAAPMLVNGRRVIAGDGVKVSKEGSLMPGVKRMHQESGDSSKGERIFGHLFGAVAAVAECAGGGRSCVPLKVNLQDGMRAAAGWEGSAYSAESHTVQTVSCAFECARVLGPCYLLLDRLFLTVPALRRLRELNGGGPQLVHLVTKAKRNCTAWERPEAREPGRAGRPRKRGRAVKLASLFDDAAAFRGASVRIGDSERAVRLRSVDLLWGQGLYMPLRFVLVECGQMRSILATTDLSAAPEQVVELYGARFGIEHMFRSLHQDVDAFGYHFWTRSCPELDRFARSGAPDRLEAVGGERDREKILGAAGAVERFVAAACVAQGAAQLAACALEPLGECGFAEYRRTRRTRRTTPRTVAGCLRKGVFSYI